ncbi:MAG: hypothetical protein LBL31_07830 [Spirochaetaceae bacterium]|nr:hypothetical protein [Spirochaetaceae bacterium]
MPEAKKIERHEPADSADSVYRFRLLTVALAPKKGLAASSTKRLQAV